MTSHTNLAEKPGMEWRSGASTAINLEIVLDADDWQGSRSRKLSRRWSEVEWTCSPRLAGLR